MSNIRVVLKDSVRIIEDRIKKAIASKFNESLSLGRATIIKSLRPMVKQWLAEQPEMIALRASGPNSLSSQLGVVSGTESHITDTIINSIALSTHVDFKRVTSNLRQGGLIIKCQLENFSNLLSLPEGFIQDKKIGTQLHWLKWLLEEGNRTIITGYHYEPKTGFGRSRGGTMSNPASVFRNSR